MKFLPVLAAAPAAAPGGLQSILLQMAPMILIFAVFYFILIRPQQQRQKQMAAMVAAVAKGDKVITTGGLTGTVWAVKEDVVVVQCNDTRLDFVKSAIVSVQKAGS